MTYEMQLTPRTTVVLQKLRVRPRGYILAQKKVTKTVAVTADHTCTVYLSALQVAHRLLQAPTPGCALLRRVTNTPPCTEQLKYSS